MVQMVIQWFRCLLRRCPDCGIKLGKEYDRGDCCKVCFDKFQGLTIQDLTNGRSD